MKMQELRDLEVKIKWNSPTFHGS